VQKTFAVKIRHNTKFSELLEKSDERLNNTFVIPNEALKDVKNTNGSPLVTGKKVTGFTNTEEAAVGLTEVVPFLVEDMLNENGGIYSKKEDWAAYAIKDGNLITGQNPASSELVAEKLLESLK
jgi:putative intracellular protease/amidase